MCTAWMLLMCLAAHNEARLCRMATQTGEEQGCDGAPGVACCKQQDDVPASRSRKFTMMKCV